MLFGKLPEPTGDPINAHAAKVMPGNHAPWMAALQRIERVGADIFVRVRAVDEEQVNLPLERRVIERGAVSEDGMNFLRNFHVLPYVPLPFPAAAHVHAIQRRCIERWLPVWRQVKRINPAAVGRIEGQMRCRVSGQSADLKDGLRPYGPAEQTQTNDVGDIRRRTQEPRSLLGVTERNFS